MLFLIYYDALRLAQNQLEDSHNLNELCLAIVCVRKKKQESLKRNSKNKNKQIYVEILNRTKLQVEKKKIHFIKNQYKKSSIIFKRKTLEKYIYI